MKLDNLAKAQAFQQQLQVIDSVTRALVRGDDYKVSILGFLFPKTFADEIAPQALRYLKNTREEVLEQLRQLGVDVDG